MGTAATNAGELGPFRLSGDLFVKAGPTPGDLLYIEGIVSSESRDADGEILMQKGLDWSYFLERGWFNDNHDQASGAGLGYPSKVETVIHKGKPATRVEGYLFNTTRGRETWEVAKAAAAAGRPMGFSIEGGIMRRDGADGKLVTRAIVRDCAITRHPKNPDTSLQVLAKALQTGEIPEAYRKSVVTAGYGGPAGDGGSGAALVPQSLQASASSAAPSPDLETLNRSQAIAFIKARLGCSPARATSILDEILGGY